MMKNFNGKNYQEELFVIAASAKDALISQWESSDADDKFFKDNDQLNEEGVMSEGIGVTAMLLLLEAFGGEEQVFSADDKIKVGEIINSSLRKLQSYSKYEYSAAPILESDKVFNANGGYTDTVTWCLSSAILARYTDLHGKVKLEDDVRKYVFDAIAKGIDVLCQSQSNGCWGFRTDLDAPRSLYYTYSASASIADFYDYILGELALLDLDVTATDADKENAINAAIDTEMVAYVSNKLGYDICEKLASVRASLQDWLIKDALPLFPKVASCTPLDDSTLNTLGMWKHDLVGEGDGNEGKKVFHHLYYTFYLLDMMVAAGVDERYEEMIQNRDEIKKLAQYLVDNGRLNETDVFYYFYDMEFAEADILNGDYHYEELFSKTVECALYAARAQYAAASKTGADFWNTAELPLTLAHPNKVISTNLASTEQKFKDPSVVAMALRSNITYSYYVTQTQDIAVERLFEDMCEDIFTKEYRESLMPTEGDPKYDTKIRQFKKKDKVCVVNLWDRENFSLALTERSIEALVDFKDYLDKFDHATSRIVAKSTAGKENKAVAADAVKSPFETALEEKIAEYLRSEVGKAIIAETIGNAAAVAPVSASEAAPGLDLKSVVNFIALVNKKNRLQYTNDGDDFDSLMSELGTLYEKIVHCNIHKFICEASPEDTDNSIKNAQQIYKQLKEFAKAVTADSRLLSNRQALLLAYSYLMENYDK